MESPKVSDILELLKFNETRTSHSTIILKCGGKFKYCFYKDILGYDKRPKYV